MGWAERTRAGSQQGQGQEGPFAESGCCDTHLPHPPSVLWMGEARRLRAARGGRGLCPVQPTSPCPESHAGRGWAAPPLATLEGEREAEMLER